MARRPDSPRRVALVHDWLNGMRGGEKVFEVLCELFPQATVFTLFYESKKVSPTIRAMNVVESSLARWPGARRHYRWLLPLLPSAVGQFPTPDFDLVISTSHCVAKSARPPRRGLHVCYCLTPMRYVWDQFDQYFPDEGGWAEWKHLAARRNWTGLGNSLNAWCRRQAMAALRPTLQRWDRHTADRVDHFLADSKNVAHKIARCYRRRAKVICPPADTDFFTIGPPGDSPPFADQPFLIVSALVPYKRIDRAIEAANQLKRPLVILGTGPERRRLEAMAGPTVRFLGWVDDATLREAYRSARALLYPGEEDFGITAVEAQACGCPVIAFGRGGALETVAEGRTGLFFHEPSQGSLAQAMQQLERTEFIPSVCRANAERFGRDRFRRTLETELGELLSSTIW